MTIITGQRYKVKITFVSQSLINLEYEIYMQL